MLQVQSLPSLGDEQKFRAAEVIMSNLHIQHERILIDKKLIIKVKFQFHLWLFDIKKVYL